MLLGEMVVAANGKPADGVLWVAVDELVRAVEELALPPEVDQDRHEHRHPVRRGRLHGQADFSAVYSFDNRGSFDWQDELNFVRRNVKYKVPYTVRNYVRIRIENIIAPHSRMTI